MGNLASQYVQERKDWVASGRRTRTKEEVEYIFESKCAGTAPGTAAVGQGVTLAGLVNIGAVQE